MRIKKVDSKSIFLHEETEVKFKTAEITKEFDVIASEKSLGKDTDNPFSVLKDVIKNEDTFSDNEITNLCMKSVEIK